MASTTNKSSRKDETGSWRNSQISTRQPFAQEAAAYLPAAQRRPAFSGLRIFLALILAAAAVLTGVAGSTAYWAQKNLVEAEGFAQVSNSLADDSEFQQQLAAAVTDDAMNSEGVQALVGNGHSQGLWGGIKNWAYEKLESGIASASQAVVEADSYPEVWNQVMAETHAYNFTSGQEKAAALDVSAIYQKIDEQVGSFLGFDPDIAGSANQVIPLEKSSNPEIYRGLQRLAQFSASWAVYAAVSAVCLLLAFALWPVGRCYFLAAVWAAGAGIFWLSRLFFGKLPDAVGQLNLESEVGQVFVEGLARELGESYLSLSSSTVPGLLVAAAVFFLVGLAMSVTKLSARGATASPRY